MAFDPPSEMSRTPAPRPTPRALERWLWVAALLAVIAWAFWRSLPAEWSRFESPEGRFAVEVPLEPTLRTRPVETAAGAIDLHLYVLEDDRHSYMASYSDYPEAIVASSTPDAMLDGARDGAALNIQGSVEEEREIALDGHPGRAVLLTDSTGELVLDLRLYLVGARLYQVGVLSERRDRGGEPAERFLGSFALLD